MIVFIIGAGTITNQVVRRYVFGLESDYYRSAEITCSRNRDAPVLARGSVVYDTYEECIAREEILQKEQFKYQFKRDMANGFSMILVSLPIFLIHWRWARKETT